MDIHGISKDIPCIYNVYVRHLHIRGIYQAYTRHIPKKRVPDVHIFAKICKICIFCKNMHMSQCCILLCQCKIGFHIIFHIQHIFLHTVLHMLHAILHILHIEKGYYSLHCHLPVYQVVNIAYHCHITLLPNYISCILFYIICIYFKSSAYYSAMQTRKGKCANFACWHCHIAILSYFLHIILYFLRIFLHILHIILHILHIEERGMCEFCILT